MFLIVGRWSLVASLAILLGMPWAFLQSVAWFGMVVSFSQRTSLSRAVAMTFDGKHPCKLCRIVQSGQAQERQEKQQNSRNDEVLQLGLPPAVVWLAHPPVPSVSTEAGLLPDPRNEPPLRGPPRSV